MGWTSEEEREKFEKLERQVTQAPKDLNISLGDLADREKKNSALGALKDLENAPLIGDMLKNPWCQEKLSKIRRALVG